EMLKNACRATTERHIRSGRQGAGYDIRSGRLDAKIPNVVVELQKGDVHVIIKISDQGGGMPKKLQEEAWEYGWSTANSMEDSDDPSSAWDSSSKAWRKELAGFGFGLPLTRLHAQYFGGDVFMQAMPGHGTDMYLLLNHLKEGSPSTETEDPSTALTENENRLSSHNAP
ncbi:unnamed protein product, partial [Polarella glacialis]